MVVDFFFFLFLFDSVAGRVQLCDWGDGIGVDLEALLFVGGAREVAPPENSEGFLEQVAVSCVLMDGSGSDRCRRKREGKNNQNHGEGENWGLFRTLQGGPCAEDLKVTGRLDSGTEPCWRAVADPKGFILGVGGPGEPLTFCVGGGRAAWLD